MSARQQPSPLDVLLARADHLSAAEADLLRTLVGTLQADLTQAKRTAGGLMAKVQQLGGQLKEAKRLKAVAVDGMCAATALADIYRQRAAMATAEQDR